MDLLINEAPVVLAVALILGVQWRKNQDRNRSAKTDRGIDSTGNAVPIVTKRPWFGPKRRLGWGWTPVSWEGWAVTFAFPVVVTACRVHFGGGLPTILAIIFCLAAYLGVILLTGTRPGGPNSPRS